MNELFEANIAISFYGQSEAIFKVRQYPWTHLEEYEFADLDSPPGFSILLCHVPKILSPEDCLDAAQKDINSLGFREILKEIAEVSIQIRMNDSDGFRIGSRIIQGLARIGVEITIIGSNYKNNETD
jgi:hypothetical protein